MRHILGLDPGGVTGWSTWAYDALTPLRPIQHGMIPGGLSGFIDWWDSPHGVSCDATGWVLDEVVCESFRLDGRTPKPDVTPLKIEGALAVLWPDTIFQPNTYKSHVTDEKLKALDLWWPGAGHDRDSARHVIASMKVRKHYPTLMWAFPPSPRS